MQLPIDASGQMVQAVSFIDGAAHSISVTATSARNSTAFQTIETPQGTKAGRIISIFATVPVYLKVGDSSVTATSSDHYFPAFTYYDFAIGKDDTHIAFIRAGGNDGTVYLSEKG